MKLYYLLLLALKYWWWRNEKLTEVGRGETNKTSQNRHETSSEDGKYWTKETFVTHPWI